MQSLLKNVKNKFWIDVLKAYSEILKFVNEQDKEEAILSSPLFYNHEIDIGGKPLWIKRWYTNGIRYVNGLLTETGDFYSQAVLERTYKIKTNFIQFQGIKQAVKLYGSYMEEDTILEILLNNYYVQLFLQILLL